MLLTSAGTHLNAAEEYREDHEKGTYFRRTRANPRWKRQEHALHAMPHIWHERAVTSSNASKLQSRADAAVFLDGRLLVLAGSLATMATAMPFPKPATIMDKFHRALQARSAPGNVLVARTAGETVTNGNLAVYTVNDYDGIGAGTDSYTFYQGDGSTADGWPDQSEWVSFIDMFNNNKNAMFSGCEQFGVADDSGPEVGSIWNAIEQVAAETFVDHRFILAVIMQESSGCVRVPTTYGSVANPGLMQDHDGSATCNYGNGDVVNPCPQSTITQMVDDGTGGTASGDGLANCLNEAPAGAGAQAFYQAARIYNSGSIDPSGDLGAGVATHCYASDIANRLTGWVYATKTCTLDG
ncbi:hypothetical protein VTN77DRAFT_7301 [Rasamsonia byssochlamydoides]|uniref:uncharacterized protein n=1 Tax=Rasamsonia byssochlamydoides TaxID=89139 RepID=UPI00374466CE